MKKLYASLVAVSVGASLCLAASTFAQSLSIATVDEPPPVSCTLTKKFDWVPSGPFTHVEIGFESNLNTPGVSMYMEGVGQLPVGVKGSVLVRQAETSIYRARIENPAARPPNDVGTCAVIVHTHNPAPMACSLELNKTSVKRGEEVTLTFIPSIIGDDIVAWIYGVGGGIFPIQLPGASEQTKFTDKPTRSTVYEVVFANNFGSFAPHQYGYCRQPIFVNP